MNTLKIREVVMATSGMATSDGDGVKLTRIIGSRELNMLDPFLMLDCFESDETQDYIGGFPTHPHRGFETVTYMLNGQMRHKDSKGNEGVITPGGVQWMSAGKGILHSEMPQQSAGLLKGFQLWVNLPKSAKMGEPAYQEFSPDKVALEQRPDGSNIRVIAGTTNQGTTGPVINAHTHPLYMDVLLVPGSVFEQSIDAGQNGFIYVIDGQLSIGDAAQVVAAKTLAVLGQGDGVRVTAVNGSSRFLLVSGTPLNEPVARGGPFVMNSEAEIQQAFDDFRHGRF